MKLSTKGRYAMVALVDLATAGEGLTTLADISKRQDVSLPYLEQLFVRLRRAGLVSSYQHAGDRRWLYYRLERAALAEVIDTLGWLLDDVEYDPTPLPCGPDA